MGILDRYSNLNRHATMVSLYFVTFDFLGGQRSGCQISVAYVCLSSWLAAYLNLNIKLYDCLDANANSVPVQSMHPAYSASVLNMVYKINGQTQKNALFPKWLYIVASLVHPPVHAHRQTPSRQISSNSVS